MIKQIWAWAVGALIVLAAALLALNARTHTPGTLESEHFRSADATGGPAGTDPQTVSANGQGNAIVPQNMPVVTKFVGDLEVQGNKENDGTLEPFVAGESLRLEVEAHNAVEYKWTCNGETLLDRGQEWSKRSQRDFDSTHPGPHTFTVQVRGSDPALLSQPKTAVLNLLPLKIMSFEKSMIHDEDQRFVTNEDIVLNVNMATGVGIDLDFYRYRYFVNDVPIKNPEDNLEWTPEDSLTYAFPAPGSYTFKVEARRATEKEAESALELPETVIVADAVLLSFDSFPDNKKGAAVGSLVNFSGFPYSRYGKSECRVGVKKINVAEYAWLEEEDGSLWGSSYRNWVPTEPGTYLVRCEIREIGKEAADDFRELYFTVTDGNF